VSEILYRYCFVLLIAAFVCVGCRGNPGAAKAADGSSAEAGEAEPAPPPDLKPGEVFASEEYSEPAKQLTEQLKVAYPGVDVSVAWSADWLRVTIHESMASESVLADLTSDRKRVHHDIMEYCFAVKAPPTSEIAVSSKTEDGSAYTDQGDWETYKGLLGSR